MERRESDLGKVDGYEVRWPDGSEAAVDQIGSYGYRLLIRLAPGRAGKVQGLLGNFDGDPDNDIASPTGPALAQPVPFEKLYPSYADSWRVTAATSLFSYAAGQSTNTSPTAPSRSGRPVGELNSTRTAGTGPRPSAGGLAWPTPGSSSSACSTSG